MSLPVVFLRAARTEYDDAIDWYEARQVGRGARFSAAVGRVLTRIADQPQLYAEVFDTVREAPVARYPYCVYYREEAGQLVVLSVFHTSRDPSVWQGRV